MHIRRFILWLAVLTLGVGTAAAQDTSQAPKGGWAKKYEGKPIAQLLPQSNQILVAVGGDSVLASVDAGDNWYSLLTEPGAELRGAFLFDPQNGWVVGSPGVIVKLEKLPNGMIANRLQNAPPGDLHSIFFRDADHGWIGGAGGALLSTRDAGRTWSSRTFQVGKESSAESTSQTVRAVTFLSETNGAALFGSNQVIVSDDGGAQWRPVNFPKGTVLKALTRQGQTLLLGGGRQLTPTLVVAGLWRSDDFGKSWKALSLGEMYGAVTGVWFADANAGFIAARGKVYATRDGGQTWTEVSDGSVAIEEIAGADVSIVWGIANGAVYRYVPPAP